MAETPPPTPPFAHAADGVLIELWYRHAGQAPDESAPHSALYLDTATWQAPPALWRGRVHEILWCAHEMGEKFVEEGRLTVYDLTQPAVMSCLLAQVTLALTPREEGYALWQVLTGAEAYGKRLDAYGRRYRVTVREGDVPALWYITDLDGDGRPNGHALIGHPLRPYTPSAIPTFDDPVAPPTGPDPVARTAEPLPDGAAVADYVARELLATPAPAPAPTTPTATAAEPPKPWPAPRKGELTEEEKKRLTEMMTTRKSGDPHQGDRKGDAA